MRCTQYECARDVSLVLLLACERGMYGLIAQVGDARGRVVRSRPSREAELYPISNAKPAFATEANRWETLGDAGRGALSGWVVARV